MYKEPYIDLVKREYEDEEYCEYLRLSAETIDNIVNFGSHIFKWAKEVDHVSGDEKIVALVLLRKTLDLLDSISILISKSSIDSSKILLRSLLEVLFETEYLLKEDSEKRAKCLMVWYMNKLIKNRFKHDPSTTEGKIFYAKLKQDQMLKGSGIDEFSRDLSHKLQKEISDIQKILKDYEDFQKEYDKIIAKNKNTPWYSMFNGPNNAYELAAEVDLGGLYETLFRTFSDTTHSNDLFEKVLNPNEAKNAINITQIRSPKDIGFTISITITFALKFYRIFIYYFFPDSKFAIEEYNKWYAKNIRDFYLKNVNINMNL